jgi:hypothetical protein
MIAWAVHEEIQGYHPDDSIEAYILAIYEDKADAIARLHEVGGNRPGVEYGPYGTSLQHETRYGDVHLWIEAVTYHPKEQH